MPNEYDYIQERAEELSSLDPEKDSELIRAIEGEICDFIFRELRITKGKAYFPGLNSRNLPSEEFSDILTDVLIKLLKNYRPEKGKFFDALKYIVSRRINDYYADKYKREEWEESYEGRTEDYGEAGEILDNSHFTKDLEWREVFLRVASIIAVRKEQEKHLSKSKRSFFEGFFTFDTVATKFGLFEGDEVVEQSEILFSVMEMVVLEYLLEGTFNSMRDVFMNKVRDEKNLNRRNETMQICYTLSKPTVVERSSRYKKFLKEFQLGG